RFQLFNPACGGVWPAGVRSGAALCRVASCLLTSICVNREPFGARGTAVGDCSISLKVQPRTDAGPPPPAVVPKGERCCSTAKVVLNSAVLKRIDQTCYAGLMRRWLVLGLIGAGGCAGERPQFGTLRELPDATSQDGGSNNGDQA